MTETGEDLAVHQVSLQGVLFWSLAVFLFWWARTPTTTFKDFPSKLSVYHLVNQLLGRTESSHYHALFNNRSRARDGRWLCDFSNQFFRWLTKFNILCRLSVSFVNHFHFNQVFDMFLQLSTFLPFFVLNCLLFSKFSIKFVCQHSEKSFFCSAQ